MANETKLKEIIAKRKPDVIIIDDFMGSPTLLYAGIPWFPLQWESTTCDRI